MKLKTVITAAAVLFSVLTAPPMAQASTVVTFQNGADGGGTSRFSLTCQVSCSGWLFDAAAPSPTIGGLIDFGDSSFSSESGDAWEKEVLLGLSGMSGPYLKDDTPGNPFDSDAAFVLIKVGQNPNVGIVKNTSGGLQRYTFTQIAGGAGLSHYSDYGTAPKPTAPPIPIPAAGWLMIVAVGGLAALRRSRVAA